MDAGEGLTRTRVKQAARKGAKIASRFRAYYGEQAPPPDWAQAERLRAASPIEDPDALDSLIREWLAISGQIDALIWRHTRGEALTAEESRTLSPLCKRQEELLKLLGVVTHRKKRSRLAGLVGGGES